MHWIGFGIHESFKQPSESSRPYGAIISAVKAAEHFFQEGQSWMKGQKGVTNDISKEPTRMLFVRPVVVLDGELLSVELDGVGSLKVTEIDMAPMHIGYKSGGYQREKYRVDVVRLSALDQYLGFVEKQHDAIRKAILELGGLGEFSKGEIYNGAKPEKKKAEQNTSPNRRSARRPAIRRSRRGSGR